MVNRCATREKKLSDVKAGSEGISKELCFGSVSFRVYNYIHTVGGKKKEHIWRACVCFFNLLLQAVTNFLVINYYMISMVGDDWVIHTRKNFMIVTILSLVSSEGLIRLKCAYPVEFPLQLNMVWVLWSFISSLSALPAQDRRSFALEQGNCDMNSRKWVLTSLVSGSCDFLNKCQAWAEVLIMLCVVSYNPGFMWRAEGWSSFSSLGCSAFNWLLKSLFSSEKSPENGTARLSFLVTLW